MLDGQVEAIAAFEDQVWIVLAPRAGTKPRREVVTLSTARNPASGLDYSWPREGPTLLPSLPGDTRLADFAADAAGPIALLGGLETNPLTLVAHFFSVALFGVGRLMVPLPAPARIWKGVNLLKGAETIIVPIVSGEGLIRMFVPSKYREKARII